jgi:hypothetical protein
LASDFFSGSSLFNCYFNDVERTANMFVTIDNQVYMKTSDLARYNAQGELIYVGRIEFQFKVNGQRVETAEIENTIMNWSPTKISNCLVTKVSQNDDLLVAYVISDDLELDTKEIRDYCNQHLLQYMIPSYFVVLDKLPFNANGKVDRKQLPPPLLYYDVPNNFAHPPDVTCLSVVSNADKLPQTKMEQRIYKIWCQVLSHIDSIPSISTSFFSLEDDPRSFIRLFHLYSTNFKHNLPIAAFIEQPTITEHARLLLENDPLKATYDQSQLMKMMEGEHNFHLYFPSNYFCKLHWILHIPLYPFCSTSIICSSTYLARRTKSI